MFSVLWLSTAILHINLLEKHDFSEIIQVSSVCSTNFQLYQIDEQQGMPFCPIFFQATNHT